MSGHGEKRLLAIVGAGALALAGCQVTSVDNKTLTDDAIQACGKGNVAHVDYGDATYACKDQP